MQDGINPFLKIVFGIWAIGLSVASALFFGMGIYYVLFLILGAVLLITCPCIGALVMGSTLTIWFTLLVYSVLVLIYTAAIAILASALLMPISWFIYKDPASRWLGTLVLILHVLLWQGMKEIGAVKVIKGEHKTERVEMILKKISE